MCRLFVLLQVDTKVFYKRYNLINSQNVPVYLFLCEPQCNFISQRTTEKLLREPQRNCSENHRENFHE